MDKKYQNDDIKKYEAETGKKAIWQGNITKGFKRWLDGKELPQNHKERIAVLLSDAMKTKWQNFAEEKNFSTISKMIRKAVNFYIDSYKTLSNLENFPKISHALKEPLTVIKGFSQLITENYSDKLDVEILLRIKEIFNQSKLLEYKINEILLETNLDKEEYDVLICDDDIPTIKVLTDYFELKGKKCKGVRNASNCLEELNFNLPKLILLDIILPDIDGYELCKKIKSNKKWKDTPIYFITAVPGSEVNKNLKESGAEGYILKPFDFSDFEILVQSL